MNTHLLRIERLSHDLRGMAFARVAEQPTTWFVEGALAGESIDAEIVRQHANRIDARVVAVRESAPERAEPACPYYGRCGGCQLQHMSYSAQLQAKQASLSQQLNKALAEAVPEVELLHDQPWHYRRRARLSARWDTATKRLSLGFRALQSQQIVDIDQCAVLEPRLSALLPLLREQLSQWARPKLIGHVELLAADNAVALVIRLLEAPNEKESTLLDALAQKTGAQILLQLAEDAEPVWWAGKQQALTYLHPSSGVELTMAPNDFVQANGAVNNLMIDRVIAALDLQPQDQLIELFSGLGNFSLPIAKRIAKVYAYEGSAQLIARARAQAERLGFTLDVRAMDLSQPQQIAAINKPANKLLLDPPRSGADVALANLPLESIERIVYVSCNPATLARDLAILAEKNFALREVVCVDMFPQTAHIEVVVLLTKQEKIKKPQLKNSKSVSKHGFKRLKR